jgi:hypothetical protein
MAARGRGDSPASVLPAAERSSIKHAVSSAYVHYLQVLGLFGDPAGIASLVCSAALERVFELARGAHDAGFVPGHSAAML